MKSEKKLISDEMGVILLGTRCSNFCVFCYGKNGKESFTKEEINHMKIEEKKRVDDVDDSLFRIKEEGRSILEISGNDPIEDKNILSVIKKAKNIGFEKIELSTHGINFYDSNFLREIIFAGVTKIKIPIYGSRKEIHDMVTKSKGSFEKTMMGIEMIAELPIALELSTLIVEQNKEDMMNIIFLLEKIKPDKFIISTPGIVDDFSFYVPYKELKKYLQCVYDYVIEKKLSVYFSDIPFCIFNDKGSGHILFSQAPSISGKYKPHGIKLIGGAPEYRLRKKIKMCQNCSMIDSCSGFKVNDVKNFGVGKLSAI